MYIGNKGRLADAIYVYGSRGAHIRSGWYFGSGKTTVWPIQNCMVFGDGLLRTG